jgi:hypothetical protein
MSQADFSSGNNCENNLLKQILENTKTIMEENKKIREAYDILNAKYDNLVLLFNQKQNEKSKSEKLDSLFVNLKNLLLIYSQNLELLGPEEKQEIEFKLIEELRNLNNYLQKYIEDNKCEENENLILNKFHNTHIMENSIYEGKNLLQILVFLGFNKALEESLKNFSFLIPCLSNDGSNANVLHWAIFKNNLDGFSIIIESIKNTIFEKNDNEKITFLKKIFEQKNKDEYTVVDFSLWLNNGEYIDKVYSLLETCFENKKLFSNYYTKQAFFDALNYGCYNSLSSLLKYEEGRNFVNSNCNNVFRDVPLNLTMKKLFDELEYLKKGINTEPININKYINIAILLIEACNVDALDKFKADYSFTSKEFLEKIMLLVLDLEDKSSFDFDGLKNLHKLFVRKQ